MRGFFCGRGLRGVTEPLTHLRNIYNKNVIVLLGQNGIGKSCIFDAIFSASQISKYQGGGLDDTYHKKNKTKPTYAEITLEDGSVVSTESQINQIKIYGRTSYRFSQDITRTQIGGQTGTQVNSDQDGRLTLNQLDSNPTRYTTYAYSATT